LAAILDLADLSTAAVLKGMTIVLAC